MPGQERECVDVTCPKCGADLGPAFIGQSVWCPKCKKWVLAERDDDDGD
jgi:endogenous inhibitor of DNA gyrase (YacG/DUF329 family)